MPLILADEFLGLLQDMRVVHIAGRTGGYKSGLAVRLFPPFAERGYRLVSNMSCVWNTPLDEWSLCEDGMLHTMLIIDEGGLYLDSRYAVRQLTAYLSKLDMILVVPSYEQPHKRARTIQVRPIFRLFHMGIPLVVYRWSMRPEGQRKEDRGFFGWLNPQEVFGVYSRQDPGDDLDEIMATIATRANERKAHYGHKIKQNSLRTVSLVESVGGAAEWLSDIEDEIEASSNELRDAIEAISARTDDIYRKVKRR